MNFDTVKFGLTGSGLTGRNAQSLQNSHPLQWEDSGFRFNLSFRFIRSKILVDLNRFYCFSSGLTVFFYIIMCSNRSQKSINR